MQNPCFILCIILYWYLEICSPKLHHNLPQGRGSTHYKSVLEFLDLFNHLFNILHVLCQLLGAQR